MIWLENMQKRMSWATVAFYVYAAVILFLYFTVQKGVLANYEEVMKENQLLKTSYEEAMKENRLLKIRIEEQDAYIDELENGIEQLEESIRTLESQMDRTDKLLEQLNIN